MSSDDGGLGPSREPAGALYAPNGITLAADTRDVNFVIAIAG